MRETSRARDPQAERLDQLVDPPGRDTADVGRLRDRDERLFRAASWLQEAREVGAAAQLRNRQLELARAGVPAPCPVAVAVREALLGRPLAAGGTDQLRHLYLDQLLHDPGQRLAQEVEALLLEQVADDLSAVILFVSAIAVTPLVVRLGGLDESERRGGRTFSRLRPTPSYTTLWDVTLPRDDQGGTPVRRGSQADGSLSSRAGLREAEAKGTSRRNSGARLSGEAPRPPTCLPGRLSLGLRTRT
jgi:hypothetical protein